MLSVDQLEDKLIDLAFAEDIGDGDHTTLCCIPEDAMGKSHLLIKEDGVLAGVEMAKKVFARFDPTMKVEVLLQDGTQLLQAVVELEDSRVVNYYEFRDELPMTEWLGGEIRIIIDEEGIRRAYWKGKRIDN